MVQVRKDTPEGYRIPKQFRFALEIMESVSAVPIQIAEQMNKEYRCNCVIHDIDDREARIAADTITIV